MTSRPRQKIPKPMTAASQKGPGGSSTSSTMLTYVGEAMIEPALDPPGGSSLTLGGSSTSSTVLTYVGEATVEPALDPPGNSPHVGCIHAFDHQIEFATALR